MFCDAGWVKILKLYNMENIVLQEELKTGNGIIKNQVYRGKTFKECRITTFYKCEFYDCTFKWNYTVHFNDCTLHNCCILKSIK